jgi:hypothetical protein
MEALSLFSVVNLLGVTFGKGNYERRVIKAA